MLVFSFGGHAATDVTLLLILIQHLSDLQVQGILTYPKLLGQGFMDGGFGNTEVLCRCPHRCTGFDYVHSQFTGSLLQIFFHRLPSDAVLLENLMRKQSVLCVLTEEPGGDKMDCMDEEGEIAMIFFNNDYAEGCHPKVLEALTHTNFVQTPGYGEDVYCARAVKKIRTLCGREDAAVHFLVGGTQTNLTVIDAALRPHQGVLCAKSGHIHVHETGAVEATGHKVLELPSEDGKITAEQVRQAVQDHRSDGSFEHMVQPKMVYISNPTELGTLYSREELKALSDTCRELDIYLFMDGARLGYGLAAKGNDLRLEDIAQMCDVFYIGGTKVGALFGEAVVIIHPALKEDFRYLIKQHGGMLAKGRLLGIQFDVLMTDNLYITIAAHADRLADRLRDALKALNVPFLVPGVTNQVFPILPDTALDELSKTYVFCEQERVDETHRAVRFCTSWATTEENVTALCNDLRRIIEEN